MYPTFRPVQLSALKLDALSTHYPYYVHIRSRIIYVICILTTTGSSIYWILQQLLVVLYASSQSLFTYFYFYTPVCITYTFFVYIPNCLVLNIRVGGFVFCLHIVCIGLLLQSYPVNEKQIRFNRGQGEKKREKRRKEKERERDRELSNCCVHILARVLALGRVCIRRVPAYANTSVLLVCAY